MAKLTIIECADCGAPRLTKRKNTKYCRVCRLIRNIEFIGADTVDCLGCDTPFAPLKRGEDVCGKCAVAGPAGDPRGTCAFCEVENASLVDSNISVCRVCATDPTKRVLFKKALVKKQIAIRSGDVVIPPPEIPKPKIRQTKTTKEVAV